MYTPDAFAVIDPATIARFMDAYPFATLVSGAGGRVEAVHLPVIRVGEGVLYGHVARANPIWESWEGGAEALVIFAGPHAYVSPRWYAPGNNVPTWNYAAVHARGALGLLEDGAHLAYLERLTLALEGPEGWRLPVDAPWVTRMTRGTVGFTVAVASLEAKFKMSQNKSAADVDGAMAHLAASPRAGDRETAEFMRGLRERV